MTDTTSVESQTPKLVDRNNTSFGEEIYKILSEIRLDKSDPLQYHQRIGHDYLIKYAKRGILAYQEMGSGKSIFAVSVCESIAEKYPNMKILMIASKSLHNNMKDNIKKYLRIREEKSGTPASIDVDAHIASTYKFVSLNAGNMLKQVHKANKPDMPDITENFDADAISERELEKIREIGDLNNTLVVIDEAHNFFNSIVHGSKNAVGLYRLIMDAKNIKLLFLTGSPIINDPFEVAVCYNMLAGKMIDKFSGVRQENTLFGEDYSDFVRYFIDNPSAMDPDQGLTPAPTIKNADKFADRITGLTSYYDTSQGDTKDLFPKLLDLEVVRVNMSNTQFSSYVIARDRELEESKKTTFKSKRVPLQKPGGSMSSYRVKSRQISNILYPPYAIESTTNAFGKFQYKKNINKLKSDVFSPEELPVWSPKFIEILKVIDKHTPKNVLQEFHKKVGGASKGVPVAKKQSHIKKTKLVGQKQKKSKSSSTKSVGQKSKLSASVGVGPVLVYSQFLDSGIIALSKALEYYGMKEVKGTEDVLKVAGGQGGTTDGGHFCIISGEVDPEIRSELLKIFNSDQNIHGEIISVLLFTSTGAEGMDTKNVRAVIAMEPYWHWARLAQVFARGVRLGSHLGLSEAERTVQPYVFLSDYPVGENTSEEQLSNLKRQKMIEHTTDVTLFFKARQNQQLINEFLRVMQAASFDCRIWNSDDKGSKSDNKDSEVIKKIKCRICKPTNRILFLENLDQDMKTQSNCVPLDASKKIIAKTIKVRVMGKNIEYKYSTDDSGDIHVYEFNKSLSGYEEIGNDNPNYAYVVSAISKADEI